MNSTKIAVFLLLVLAPARSYADIGVRSLPDGALSPPAKIEQLAWLEGHWVGEGLGGAAEEIIAPASGGQMMGMFRHSKADGSLNFYEFYVFAEVGETITLKIKHFTPEFVGWEEKADYDEFPLIAVDDNTVYFDGLTFALDGVDGLKSAVQIEERGVAGFQFRRAD
ncbi:MAG: hypothetical protein HKN14_00705 [Marinicaulis sp.]|nr:hypothetical protein [Marinicaulis sp.]NNE39418.1 hypothetical protein [Marinicaulis sp.]